MGFFDKMKKITTAEHFG